MKTNTRDFDLLPVQEVKVYIAQTMSESEQVLMSDDGEYLHPFTWAHLGRELFLEKEKAIKLAETWEKETKSPTRVYEIWSRKVVWPEYTRNRQLLSLEVLRDNEWVLLEVFRGPKEKGINLAKRAADIRRQNGEIYRVVDEFTQTVVY